MMHDNDIWGHPSDAHGHTKGCGWVMLLTVLSWVGMGALLVCLWRLAGS